MKKLYSILGLCAMFALPALAQEEDMTSYISNPGFDEDLTFQADGTMKTAVSTDEALSTRSYAYVAEDNTCYCYTSSFSDNWSRTSDSWAINGFIGQVKGWTLESNKSTSAPFKTSSPEWVYFGTLPYALGETAVPVADNGSTYLVAPAKPAECDTEDNVGFAYLRAGWGGQAIYKQVVQLPCAQYRLDYWIYNANYESSKSSSAENLCKVICRKDVFPDETGFSSAEWTKHSIEFTPTSEFTIQFGFKSSGGSNSNPFVCIDGIKLYKIGEADEAELLQADIMEMVDSINGIVEDNLSEYGGVADEVADKMSEFEDIAYSGETEQMEQGIKDIKVYAQTVNDFVATANEFSTTLETAATLLESENPYPGIDALQTAVDKAQETLSTGTMEQVTAGVAELNAAILAYYTSQPASPEQPADYTFLVDTPWFGNGINGDTAAQGNWTIGTSGGDQAAYKTHIYGDGTATCWNAWRNTASFTDLRIQQALTDLPNGYYTVSAEMVTQDGCVNDQHLFATSSVATAVSPVLNQDNISYDGGLWETLTTEKVIVVDGKLTIGALGNGTDVLPGSFSDYRQGWYCVTNFKLSYLGAASEEEYAAAVQAKIDAAKAYAETMHLAADKATFLAAANEAKGIEDLDALNAAQKIAEASESEYAGIMAGSYQNLQDSIASSVLYSATDKKVAQVPVDHMTAYLASAEATYTKTGDITTVLRYYRDTLIPALQAAEATELTDATAKAALQGTIDAFVAKVASYEEDTEVLAEYIAELQEGVAIAEKADIAYGDNTDVTAYITNPTVDAITGWTVNKPVGDGNGRKTSQQVDGDTAGGYIDTYNSTVGALRATIYQTLNVPNGSYKIENIMRAPGRGAYLFAQTTEPAENAEGNLVADANVVLAEAIAPTTNATKYINSESTATDSLCTDSYGAIWCAAADRVVAALNVTGTVLDATGNRLYDLAVEANNGSTECPANVDKTDWAVMGANSGTGRGWFDNSLEITVTNHTLVIGVSCDSVFVNKATAYTGTWFSADNFKLTLVKAGDNAGWNPATAIEAVATEPSSDAKVAAVYSVSGARTNGMKKGVNIVRYANGDVKKVMVK